MAFDEPANPVAIAKICRAVKMRGRSSGRLERAPLRKPLTIDKAGKRMKNWWEEKLKTLKNQIISNPPYQNREGPQKKQPSRNFSPGEGIQ